MKVLLLVLFFNADNHMVDYYVQDYGTPEMCQFALEDTLKKDMEGTDAKCVTREEYNKFYEEQTNDG